MVFILAPNCGTVCSRTPLRLLQLTDGSKGITPFPRVCVYVPACVCVPCCSAHACKQMCVLAFLSLCCLFDKRSLWSWNVSALMSAWFSPGVHGVKMPPQECRLSWSSEINTIELWLETDVCFDGLGVLSWIVKPWTLHIYEMLLCKKNMQHIWNIYFLFQFNIIFTFSSNDKLHQLPLSGRWTVFQISPRRKDISKTANCVFQQRPRAISISIFHLHDIIWFLSCSCQGPVIKNASISIKVHINSSQHKTFTPLVFSTCVGEASQMFITGVLHVVFMRLYVN